MKTLYQIENSKSGRRVIYKGFDKYKWSEGDGEDGTFFEEDQVQFIMNLLDSLNEIRVLEYTIRALDDWPVLREKKGSTHLIPEEEDEF